MGNILENAWQEKVLEPWERLQVLRYLADTSRWQFRDESAWLFDETRKWHSHYNGNTEIKSNREGSKHLVFHKQGACIFIEEHAEKISAVYGDGSKIEFSKNKFRPFTSDSNVQRANLRLADSKNSIFLNGLLIDFDESGRLYICFAKTGETVVFQNLPAKSGKILRSGKFFQTLPFNAQNIPSGICNSPVESLKAVLAYDLKIEPDLPLDFNRWSLSRQHDYAAAAPGLPHKFSIESIGNAHYKLATDTDTRAHIINKSHLLIDISQIDYDECMSSADQFPQLLRDLESGFTGHDQNGRAWSYAVFSKNSHEKFSQNAFNFMTRQAGVDLQDCLSFNLNPAFHVIGVAQDRLETFVKSYHASVRVVEAVRQGIPGNQNTTAFLADCLAQGADYKYVRPPFEDEKKSFADYFEMTWASDFSKALKEIQGARELDAPTIGVQDYTEESMHIS